MQRMYKFTKKDIKILQDFINTIDKDIKIKKGRTFECDVEKKQVFVNNKKYTLDTEIYMNWLCKQKEYIPINHVLISILHEIGHIKTYSLIKEKQRTLLYSIYSFLQNYNILSVEELNEKYFNIPDEKDATMWGIEFYKNHKIQCDELVKKLCIM
jgi:hypothetical protein